MKPRNYHPLKIKKQKKISSGTDQGYFRTLASTASI
jgi:hypothetical protein